MTEYKNQHYIPQFYLRHFSSDGAGVYRYSLKNDITERSNIEKTCASFWFYAASSKAGEFESVLSPLEARHAEIIQEILDTHSLGVVSPWSKNPQHSYERFLCLCQFILLTSTRTKLAKSEVEAVANFAFDSVMKPYLKQSEKVRARGIKPEFVDGLRVSRDTANLEGMIGAMVGSPLISDLVVGLLINETKKPFITSDSPAVFYNFLDLEDQELLGWQSPGLMIFMPLSEKYTLWLLDPEMYKPRVKAQRSIVSLTREQDVDELNRLQMLNADDYLIFSSADSHGYVSSQYEPLKSRRRKTSVTSEKWSEFDVGDEHHEIFKLGHAKINYKPHLSFFKKDKPRITQFVKNYKKAYKEHIAKFGRTRPSVVVRNQDLCWYFETEMKKLIKKQEGNVS